MYVVFFKLELKKAKQQLSHPLGAMLYHKTVVHHDSSDQIVRLNSQPHSEFSVERTPEKRTYLYIQSVAQFY